MYVMRYIATFMWIITNIWNQRLYKHGKFQKTSTKNGSDRMEKIRFYMIVWWQSFVVFLWNSPYAQTLLRDRSNYTQSSSISNYTRTEFLSFCE